MIGSLSSFGLEVGPTALRVAEMRRGPGGRLVVRRLDRLEIPGEGSAGSPDARAAALRRAFALFSVSHVVRRRDVVVIAISGVETDNRVVSLPPVAGPRLVELARAEALTLNASPGQGARHAFHVLPRISVNEKRVLVASHPAAALEEILAAAGPVGLAPDAVVPAPLALASFLDFDLRGVEDALLLHVGSEETAVVCLPGDSVWFRSLPFGSRVLARAMAAAPGAESRAAEAARISITRGEAVSGSEEASRAFLDRLVGEVRRALDFHRRRIGAFLPSRIFLTGDVARIPGAAAHLAEVFHVQVEPVVRLNRVRISHQAYASSELRDLPSFVVALGAALQGLERVRFPVSFADPDRTRASARSVPALAAAGAILLGTALLGDLSASRERERAEALVERTQRARSAVVETQERWRRREEVRKDRAAVLGLAPELEARALWEIAPARALAALGAAGEIGSCDVRSDGGGLRLEFSVLVRGALPDPERAFQSRVAEVLRSRAGARGVTLREVEEAPVEPGSEPGARILHGSAFFGGGE
ncbi:MAG: pilus assembly protein PilM [Planctomycetes bacterium]|nr:pilus assembly protein PilM [Planctomycetota bacterium]